VDLLFGHQLQPVFDRTQQPVRVVERPGVASVDVPADAQFGQGLERGGRTQGAVVAAMHELEELDGELDVTDPTPAPLDLPVGETTPGQAGFGPGLHGPYRPQVPGRDAQQLQALPSPEITDIGQRGSGIEIGQHMESGGVGHEHLGERAAGRRHRHERRLQER